MFKKKPSLADEMLDDAIISLMREMDTFTGDTPEYARLSEQLDKLYKIKDNNRPDSVKADTLALIAGNLAGILMIVGHERANVVTSKAISFVSKLK